MSNLIELMSGCVYKLALLREQERSLWLRRLTPEKKRLNSTEIDVIEIVYKNEKSSGNEETSYAEIVNEIDKRKRTNLQTTKSAVSQAISRLKKKKYLSKYSRQVRKPTVKLTDKGWGIGYVLHNIDRFLILKLLASESNFSESLEEKIRNAFERTFNVLSFHDTQKEDVEAIANANTARLYDYLIGGSFFLADEVQAVNQMKKIAPFIDDCAKANRAFMRRAVEFLAEEKGIRQFIDIGAGLLSYGNIHEIVSKHFVDYKVLYVDNDLYVVNVLRYILSGEKNTRILQAGLKDTDMIWDEAKKLGIEPSEPVGIIAVAMIHFIENFDVAKNAIEKLCQKLCLGSYLVISHANTQKNLLQQGETESISEQGERVVNLYSKLVKPVFKRSESEIKEIFDKGELKLVPAKKDQSKSDLVFAPQWRPDIPDKYLFGSEPPLQKTPEQSFTLVGVGKKVKTGK